MIEKSNPGFAGNEVSVLPVFPDADAAISRQPMRAGAKTKPKRGNSVARTVLEHNSGEAPACATTDSSAASLWKNYFVPVSFAAKDWNVTPRRIRSLLAAERLEGRREANGYWEVAYPYRFVIGTRGPVLKRQQKPKRGRPKAEGMTE